MQDKNKETGNKPLSIETKTVNPKTDGSADAGSALPSSDILLSIRDLKVHFPITRGIIFQHKVGAVRAVDGVSFDVKRGETLGLVGESGCGKSTTGRAILRLNNPTSGQMYFNGEDITLIKGKNLKQMRRNMTMIFQDPYASLNPRMTVANIISEPLIIHGLASGKARQERVEQLLEQVGLSKYFTNRYPHEFSGGQRQRIGIARALAANPSFIVADEPVSALDVSIQAQIVNLMEDLQAQYGLTYLIVAHDLSVVRHISNRVAVMYLGKIVELSDRDELYIRPSHPYTVALLSAVPIPDPKIEKKRQRIILTGDVPSPVNPPSGCRFHTRCPLTQMICKEVEPEFRNIGSGHFSACHFAEDVASGSVKVTSSKL
ncbi:dipeptide ABC transporter ATP-binding protein [Candidatus Chlorohelix sp.]|uniref:ABC transporter ATP-binding protein n=1 Tax=Candidatus Chlorohelix sp. TaxID=3139201 RepID=UPI0030261180